MRFRTIAIIAAVLLAVAFIGQRVFFAIQHTFHKPPRGVWVDPSTPKQQGALTLLEIQPVSQANSYNYTPQGPQKAGGTSGALEADIGLWIKMGAASQSLGSGCDSADNSPCAKQLLVTGRASNGDTFPLPWKTMSDNSAPGTPTPAPMLLAMIPAGYPDTYQWVDVSVDNHQGQTAHWRITHLPPSQHVLAPPVALQTTFKQGHVTAAAHAYRSRPAYYPPGEPMLLDDIKATITPATHQWELGHFTEALEWEPPGFTPHMEGLTIRSATTSKSAKSDIGGGFVFNQSFPYPKDQRFLRLTAQLQQYETYDEKVTFHNVSIVKVTRQNITTTWLAPMSSQAVATPSGITVTLADAQTQASSGNGATWKNQASMALQFTPGTTLATLSGSPLWREYRKTVTVEARLPAPYGSTGSSQRGNGPRVYNFQLLPNHPKMIPNFTVIVRQRVDLQAVPMTFTLPIENKKKTP